MDKTGKGIKTGTVWMVVAVIALAVIFAPKLGITLPNISSGSVAQPQAQVSGSGVTQCAQNPSYTYDGINVHNGSAVGGTEYVKEGNLAPVTSLSGPSAGKPLELWVSTTTSFCEPKKDVVQCGTHNMQANCYENGTVTLTMYNDAFSALTDSTTGATNVTLAANDLENGELRFQGTKYYSSYPFGGCVAVEYPTSITSFTMTGALSTAVPCPYGWTYTVANSGNAYKLFAIPAGFDAAGDAIMKTSNYQIASGATNPGEGSKGRITLRAANYFKAKDGNFYLGLEKTQDADTTTTAFGDKFIQFGIQ